MTPATFLPPWDRASSSHFLAFYSYTLSPSPPPGPGRDLGTGAGKVRFICVQGMVAAVLDCQCHSVPRGDLLGMSL